MLSIIVFIRLDTDSITKSYFLTVHSVFLYQCASLSLSVPARSNEDVSVCSAPILWSSVSLLKASSIHHPEPPGPSHCLTPLILPLLLLRATLSPPWRPQGTSSAMESMERDAGPSLRRSASLLGIWGIILYRHRASMMSLLSQVQKTLLLVCDCS